MLSAVAARKAQQQKLVSLPPSTSTTVPDTRPASSSQVKPDPPTTKRKRRQDQNTASLVNQSASTPAVDDIFTSGTSEAGPSKKKSRRAWSPSQPLLPDQSLSGETSDIDSELLEEDVTMASMEPDARMSLCVQALSRVVYTIADIPPSRQ